LIGAAAAGSAAPARTPSAAAAAKFLNDPTDMAHPSFIRASFHARYTKELQMRGQVFAPLNYKADSGIND
jgi:hypothetical protein